MVHESKRCCEIYNEVSDESQPRLNGGEGEVREEGPEPVDGDGPETDEHYLVLFAVLFSHEAEFESGRRGESVSSDWVRVSSELGVTCKFLCTGR